MDLADYDYEVSELWILVLATEKYMPYSSQACFMIQWHHICLGIQMDTGRYGIPKLVNHCPYDLA